MLDLTAQQEALEAFMLEEAHARQRTELERATKRREGSATRSGKYYVKTMSALLNPFVMGYLNPEKKAGRAQIVAQLLKATEIEPELISYLTVKAILNVMCHAKAAMKRVSLSRLIGEKVHDEWRIRMFADDKSRKALLKKLFLTFDKKTYPREWRRRTIKNYFDADIIDWQGWSDRQKVQIGHVLLLLFNKATENAYLESLDGGTKYGMTDQAVQHLANLSAQQVSSFILYRPMLIPPRPWTDTNLFRGGYRTNKVKRYPIVKGSGKRDVKRFCEMDWSQILPSINSLQETPWRVNTVMLEALEWAYYTLTLKDDIMRRGGIGKLVPCEPIKLPPEPYGYNTDEAVTKEHNKLCFMIHSRNREDKSRRIAALMAISTAKRFADYEAIYFPHNLDSRGRAYPLPAVLNPQGPDYVKALLEFSVGEPIENEGQAAWLAIAGANAYGNDKISLEDRVRWVHDNQELIGSVASDYRSDLRWLEASEPFVFLRFCLEWQAYTEQGFGYLSHMVCAVDATCSGLQHYSGMLRDSVGGKSVNLVPGLPRQDIYGDVASVVIEKLKAEEEHTSFAQGWLHYGLARRHTKRQVMVVPYAGKFSSCLTYTREAIADDLKEGAVLPWDKDDEQEHHNRLVYLAKLIWAAIDEVVVKGKEAMKWLSGVAKEFAKTANGTFVENPFIRRMTWLTPDGFEVLHYREDQDKTLVDSYLDGRTRLVMYEYNGRLNVGDMSLAVAPNFVHALDATHMRMTIEKAKTMGINHFGMVHDSFGVHARYMPEFVNGCIKPMFVKMYEEHDVLQELYEQYVEVCPEIEPPPEKGTLDLKGVLVSEFVFS